MRSIENTITEYDGQPHTGRDNNHWVFYGNLAVVYIPSTNREVVHGIQQVVNDLFQPDTANDPASTLLTLATDGSGVTYTVKTRYTTHFAKVTEVLANAAEHYRLPGIRWTAGTDNTASATTAKDDEEA